jgi:hypothetical protein
MNEVDIETLVSDLYNAKKAEEQAKAARIAAEEAVAAALGGPDNGSRTFTTGTLKVTVKRGYNYKVSDMDAFETKFPSLVKTTVKKELNAKEYEAMRVNCDDISDIAAYITATPKKVSVELKM